MLIEGCKLGPIARAVAATLRGARFVWDGPAISGFHRLEHTRLKTGTTPG
jgi:hypothetical protein